MTRVLGLLTARMGSSRAPGKAMMDLAGKPMVGHIFDRMQRVKGVDKIFLGTTADPRNAPLVEYAESVGVEAYQHPDEDDVVARISTALREEEGDVLLVTGGDCPLIDPIVLQEMVDMAVVDPQLDFVSPRMRWTYPVGLSADVLSRRAIEMCNEHLEDPDWRYEIGIYIRNSARFKAAGVYHEPNLAHYMWTVDWPEDVVFMKRLFNDLYKPGEVFGLKEVLAYLEERGETFEGEPFAEPWPMDSFVEPWPLDK